VTTNFNPEKGKLSCEAWESMLADALDGTLSPADAAAFTTHSDGCAACSELLEQAKQGSEWLGFLHEAPPAPQGLVERILAGTSGLPTAGPLLAAGAAVAIPHQPWLSVQRGLLSRHMAESRILMTLAMAFFSIALTLNLTGVHLNQLRLADLKPTTLASALSHQYFATSKNVQRYYSNLRFVYEVESRLNEIRQPSDRPAAPPDAAQPGGQPQAQPSPTQPGQSEQSHPARKGGGGSARKDSPAPTVPPAAPGGLGRGPSVPALAQYYFDLHPRLDLRLSLSLGRPPIPTSPTLRACSIALPYPGNLQSERSLV
jgi:Putative zinc-finger